ncbi:MAG: DNA repair protein RadC, partial [Chitinophagales bacterium]|nr:DNA repair protein RadC [Chitinophagales bacterium]
MQPYENKFTIKCWAEEDRPREKLQLKGKQALSDAELIAIIIGSGNAKESAVELSKRILASFNNNLFELGQKSIEDLMQFNGIGEAKAISIIAALEIGRRRASSEVISQNKIITSKDVFQMMSPILSDLKHEEFWVIYLNRNNRFISKQKISSGGVAGTVSDPKIIFNMALKELASSIILCHNHPSGNLIASEADIYMTKKIRQAGDFLDIKLLDHIIIAHHQFTSFIDSGLL